MDFILHKKALRHIEGELLVCGVYADRPLSGLEARIDDALGNLPKRLLGSGALSAEYGALNDPLYTDGTIPAEKVLFVGLGKKDELDAGKVRDLSSKVAAYVAQRCPEGVCLSSFADSEEFAMEMALSLTTACYAPDEEKTERKKQTGKATLLYAGKSPAESLCRGRITGEAVNYARMLNNAGSNIVTPERLAHEARALGSLGLAVDILDRAALEEEGFGALLAVARGSARDPYVGIITYHCSDDADTIALLGKGLTFDSGGVCQKPGAGMENMRMDMSGAGNVLAVMRAVAELRPGVNVIGMFGAVENKDSATGYNPGDIITSRSGKTIEIMNTDAEGRNVLIDLIDKALEYNPDAIIDMATLTGACATALGSGAQAPAGAFANLEGNEMLDRLLAASERSGEKIWHLPSGEFYQKHLASDRADLRHTGESGGGASSAAQFLFNFSGDVPHVHLDMAGTAISKNATGWGVQLILDYLLNG